MASIVLTDAEREALEFAIRVLRDGCGYKTDTLESLLARASTETKEN